jgi:hypothetical protein
MSNSNSTLVTILLIIVLTVLTFMLGMVVASKQKSLVDLKKVESSVLVWTDGYANLQLISGTDTLEVDLMKIHEDRNGVSFYIKNEIQ